MPELEWWQSLAALGGFLVAVDRLAGVLERLGGVYGRFGRWLKRTYAERAAQEARDLALERVAENVDALTGLVKNGINEKVEVVGEKAEVAVGRAELAVREAEAAVMAAAELAKVVERHRNADRAALDDHITQSMEEHSALGMQITRLGGSREG